MEEDQKLSLTGEHQRISSISLNLRRPTFSPPPFTLSLLFAGKFFPVVFSSRPQGRSVLGPNRNKESTGCEVRNETEKNLLCPTLLVTVSDVTRKTLTRHKGQVRRSIRPHSVTTSPPRRYRHCRRRVVEGLETQL